MKSSRILLFLIGFVLYSSFACGQISQSGFYLPENPSYTIYDSVRDSVRFAEFTLVPYKGHLCSKSSFVDQDGNIMGWHDFGNLEGPGWAANAVGGAYEIYLFARHVRNPSLEKKAVSLLDHVLENGFIDYETGFITGYRETTTNKFCLNYQHKNNWFCPGSMAKVAYQLLIFSDELDGERKRKMRDAAIKMAEWLKTNVKSTSNGWFPRRCEPSGKHYPQNAYGDSDILFEKSGDGLFIIQLYTGLTKRGLADYTDIIRKKINVFIKAGGFFGSINHDTYDEHENVAYSVAFRVLREAAKLLDDKNIRAFAFDKCLAGLEQFKMKEDRNSVQTKGLLFMEKSWDTSYLWENAEAALAYLEAYTDTKNQSYLSDALTILRAIAKHHHGQHGFLTEGVDWNNHVGKQHHFNQAEYGDIRYTEPLLNNLHIVEPTLLVIKLEGTPIIVHEKQAKHLVPADKILSQDAVRLLFERGKQEVYNGSELETIGMPVGGIASGQLYLRGDGTLGLWQIFNKHVFTGYGLECYRTYRPDSPVDSGFAVVVEQDGKTFAKTLNKDFGKVEFAGSYPIGNVSYREDGFPVSVSLKAYSPFIPLNAKDSALPATIFRISVRNTSTKKLSVSLLGWLENAVLIDSAKSVHALRRSRIVNENKRTLIVHTAEKAPAPKGTTKPRPKIVMADFEDEDYNNWTSRGQAFGKGPANGTLASQQQVRGFLGKGLVNTFLGGDKPHGTLTSPPFKISRKFINFIIGGGNHSGQTCINLLIDDKVVRTATGKSNEKLEWYFWNLEQLDGKTAKIQIVDKFSGGWGHINIDQIELSDEPHKGPMGPLDKLPDYGSLVLALSKEGISPRKVRNLLTSTGDRDVKLYSKENVTWPVTQRQSTALAAHSVELAPGATRTLTFVLAWFFPNHSNGREYANHFNNATDVAHYVLDNYNRLAGNTDRWHKTYYEHSTLPQWLLFRLHSTVSNLATGTCQWWKNGRFWAWEGVGCCAGTCTHVWNYAHAPARLFPQLERSAREMQDFGEGFDSESGLVGFRSNRAYAADGQCGSVLKAYREHQASADYSFLKRNWPRIKKALEFSIQQDGNDDGLIENSQHNTYDINFEGPNTFVGSLYLAALRAAEEMAKDMGDRQFAKRCRKIFESGSRRSVERLWDGEYFIQLVDLQKHPKFQYAKGCLSDQLFGQGWAHQLGLGYIYPPKQVKRTLQSVWKYNWAPDIGPYNAEYKPERWFASPGEAGLFTCTWPKSPYHKEGVRYKSEVWTGIEYQVAGHMVWEGMLDEALVICRGIHDRYHPAKHNPFNEVECGDHYARAMASWGVYTALAGYEYHGPKGHLGFTPKITPENFRAAFTAAEGWGLFAQKRDSKIQRERIELRWGKLNLKTLAFTVPEDFHKVKVVVTLDRKTLNNSHKLKDGRLEITLTKKLAISENQILDIAIQQQDK